MKLELRARVALLLVAVLASGCAHGVSRRTRMARALVGAGAVVAVAGVLVAAGCAGPGEGEGCSGGPDDADLASGIPIIAIGAGLIAGGLLMRDKRSGRLLPSPGSLTDPVPLNRPVPY